jgi:hypothetical protein
MIKVNKTINLEQLDQELNGQGLVATLDENNTVIEVGLAENNTASEQDLQIAIDNHISQKCTQDVTLDSAITKLKALGLTEEEAKIIIGLE